MMCIPSSGMSCWVSTAVISRARSLRKFTKTTESAIVDRIKALDSNNGNTRLNGAFAPKFVEWVESLGGFNKDQLGTTRTTSGTWPGSVELK